jgi:MoaA/NifB/PqqE/SkfB family radical SAM enzyme
MEPPKEVIISLTNLCTTSCPFCYRRDLHLEPRYFPFENFKSLLDELGPGLDMLEFSGIGEPLMHPQFKEFVLYVRQKYPPSKLKLQLVSNGSLLSTDLRDFLLEQMFEQVWISVNAATAKTYSRLMPGLDFEALITRTRSLREARERASLDKPLIFFSFVVNRENYLEAEDFPNIGIAAGADRIGIRPLDRLLNRKIYEAQHVSREQFESILGRIEARARLDSRIECPPRWAFWPDKFLKPNRIGAKAIYCPNVQRTFGIYFSSGEVTPCCYMAAYVESPENCLGNIYHEKAINIWNGGKAESLRESLNRTGSAPDICRECTNYWGKRWVTG